MFAGSHVAAAFICFGDFCIETDLSQLMYASSNQIEVWQMPIWLYT